MSKKYFLLVIFYFILAYYFPFEIFPSVRYEPWEDDVSFATGKVDFCAGVGVERFGYSFAFRGKCREDILFLEAIFFVVILTLLTHEILQHVSLLKKTAPQKKKRQLAKTK